MFEVTTVVGCAVCFIGGYALGRIDTIVSMLRGNVPSTAQPTAVTSFLDVVKSSSKQKKPIQIDDRKFVTEVSTDDLSSVGEQNLGTVTTTDDNVANAANKLAQLKKLKG